MKILTILFLFYTVSSFSQTTDSLLFKSSFNHAITVNKDISWNHHLRGTDSITGYTFPNDLPGDTSEHFFNYVVGDLDHYEDYANAEVGSTIGSDGLSTNALFIEFIKDDTDFVSYSRVQYVIYGDSTSSDPVQRMNKGYIKYKIKMNFLKDPDAVDWNLPIELKDTDDDGFRMGLYVYDSNSDEPYWVAKGQYMIDGGLGDDVWQYNNYEIAVVEDEWFEIEFFWLAAPSPTVGRFMVNINGETLFDITEQTKDPEQPDKMYYFMPFKVYGNVGSSWITDFEYWTGWPDSTLSIENFEKSIENFAFPNPAKNSITLSSELLNKEFIIYSLEGKTITKGTVISSEMDISKLENGMYIVQFFDANKAKIWEAKIVKE